MIEIIAFLFLLAFAWSARTQAIAALEQSKDLESEVKTLREAVTALEGIVASRYVAPAPPDQSAVSAIDAPMDEATAQAGPGEGVGGMPSQPLDGMERAEAIPSVNQSDTVVASSWVTQQAAASEPPVSIPEEAAFRTDVPVEDIPTAAAAPPGGRDVEQAVATRWSLWIGGIALGVGGLLIVRHSIESGFFGPGVRLLLGCVFALLLAGLSEFIRRRDLRPALGGLPPDQIPTVLAGVSVLTAFGVVYSAHAVYDMIGPSTAFAVMGLIGLSALAASALHGPWFGLFGLLGSYLTPLLVSSDAPSFAALALFIIAVTASAMFLQLRRPALPVALGAIAGHALWILAIGQGETTVFWAPILVMVAVALSLIYLDRQKPVDLSIGALVKPQILVRLASLAIPLVLAGVLWVLRGFSLAGAVSLVVVIAGAVFAAIRHAGLSALAPLAGAGATGMVLLWPLRDHGYGISPHLLFDVLSLKVGQNNAPGLPAFAMLASLLVTPPVIAAFHTRWRNADSDGLARGCLSFAAALTPIAILLATSLRLNGFDRSLLFAVLCLAVSFGLAACSEWLFRQRTHEDPSGSDLRVHVGSAAFAVGAAIGLGLSIALALRETWLVVGFAVSSCCVAALASKRPLPLLRSISAALGTAALARVVWQPILHDVGSLSVLNWLVVIYGVPAMAFAVAAYLLGSRRDRAVLVLEALAAGFLAATVLLQIWQAFVGPDLTAVAAMFATSPTALDLSRAEASRTGFFALLSIGLAILAVGFRGLALGRDSTVLGRAEQIASTALIATTLACLCVMNNPLLSGVPVMEPVLINRLLFGFAGLGVALLVIDRSFPCPSPSSNLSSILQALGLVLVALGATLVVRHSFSGPVLNIVDGPQVKYFESVSVIALWSVTAAMIAYWHGKVLGPVPRLIFKAIAWVTLIYALGMMGAVHNPLLFGGRVDGPIFFNRLLWGYVPVVAALAMLAVFARDMEAGLARTLAAGSGALGLLMTVLLVRHGFHGAHLASAVPIKLAEAGLYGLIIFSGASIAILKEAMGNAIRPGAAEQIAGLSIAFYAFLLAVGLFGGDKISGWPLLNTALPGLVLPGLMMLGLAWLCRSFRLGIWAYRLFGLAAIAVGLAYTLAQVRYAFPDENWLEAWTSAAHRNRMFGYSFAMIGYALAVLAVGFRIASRDVRLAALGVVALAVLKVFLLDMAGLSGLWRAFSFIGLGGSLIGIAYLYRMLLADPAVARGKADRTSVGST